MRLHAAANLVGSATVRGSIFLVGLYPGYRTVPDGVVHGEVWRLHDPGKMIAALDKYEGSKYRCVVVATSLGEAWIYEYIDPVEASTRIESGDFLVR